jgi:hypothetical protein
MQYIALRCDKLPSWPKSKKPATSQKLLYLNKIRQVKFANIVSNYDVRIYFTYEILQIDSNQLILNQISDKNCN